MKPTEPRFHEWGEAVLYITIYLVKYYLMRFLQFLFLPSDFLKDPKKETREFRSTIYSFSNWLSATPAECC